MAVNYDDAFRTLLNDCPQLILPLINEAFNANYDGTEKIIFEPNEHFVNRKSGEENKIVTDTSFAVVSNVLTRGQKGYIRKFHWECESKHYDPTILIRFYEYGSQIALDYNQRIEGDELIVEFPNAALLLLRAMENTPDQMRIRVVLPNGESASYPVPTVKVQKYTLEEIYRKQLLFLLPFYLMRYDNRLEKMEEDEKAVRELTTEFEQIRQHLDELTKAGNLTLASKHIIMDMINHVAQLRCAKLNHIREGVKQIMVGTLLYSEAYEVLKQGREEENENQIITGIQRAMDKQHLSLDGAMDYMDIPRNEWYKYAQHFCEPAEAAKYQSKD